MARKGYNIDLAYDDITRPKWYERLRLSDKWYVYIEDCNALDVAIDWRTNEDTDDKVLISQCTRRPSQDELLALVNVKFAARIANRLVN